MKLTYRGVQYDYTPPTVESTITDEVGKFRGVDIRFRSLKKAPVQQPSLDLVYRGVAYRTSSPETPAMPSPAAVQLGAEERARSIMMGHHRADRKRQQSMLGRLAAEVGLSVAADQHWHSA